MVKSSRLGFRFIEGGEAEIKAPNLRKPCLQIRLKDIKSPFLAIDGDKKLPALNFSSFLTSRQ